MLSAGVNIPGTTNSS